MSKITIDKLKEITDIVTVVGHFISLKKSGARFSACCPFHNEKTASFIVTPDRNMYKCYGCGAGGDAISFVMNLENLKFFDACKTIAEIQGYELEEREFDGELSKLYKANEFAAKKFAGFLAGSPAYEYIKKRGISNETLQEFRVGFAPPQNTLANLGTSEHKAVFEKLGLIKNNDGYYDFFRNRVMFPFIWLSGKVTGFSGRDITGESSAKYINSIESEIFHKGQILFGMYQARKTIASTQTAVVVEGQIDVLACHTNGFKDVVCTGGTAFTDEHAKQLKRIAEKVLVIFDADTAGLKAMHKTAEILISNDIEFHVLLLPDGEDPASYLLKFGKEAFKNYIVKNEKEYFDFCFDYAREKQSDRQKTVRHLSGVASLYTDLLKREQTFQRISKEFDFSVSAVKQAADQNRITVKQPTDLAAKHPHTLTSDEQDLLFSLFTYADKIVYYEPTIEYGREERPVTFAEYCARELFDAQNFFTGDFNIIFLLISEILECGKPLNSDILLKQGLLEIHSLLFSQDVENKEFGQKIIDTTANLIAKVKLHSLQNYMQESLKNAKNITQVAEFETQNQDLILTIRTLEQLL